MGMYKHGIGALAMHTSAQGPVLAASTARRRPRVPQPGHLSHEHPFQGQLLRQSVDVLQKSTGCRVLRYRVGKLSRGELRGGGALSALRLRRGRPGRRQRRR